MNPQQNKGWFDELKLTAVIALIIAFFLAIPFGTVFILVSGFIPFPYNWFCAIIYFSFMAAIIVNVMGKK